MPVRIMHVVNNLGKGGLENGLVNVIERMDPSSFEHVVCTIRGLGPNVERLPKERVKVLCLNELTAPSRVQTPALLKAIRRTRPDIVHSRNWAAIEGVFAARLARVPAVVHSEHGFETNVAAPESLRKVWFRRVAFELADRVFSVSWQLRDLHAARTRFPRERISVIHNGVDSSRFYPDARSRAAMRSELGLRDGEVCIGCVANLLPVKDHRTLLEALSAFDASDGDWRLVLAGEGFLQNTLQAFAQSRPALRKRVTFLGPSARVPELLRAMDVFVLPSVAEGICNSLLEAMATGVAVVATRVGGNPEVVVEGKSGLLFQPGDIRTLTRDVSRLVHDPQLRAALGREAIARVQQEFSLSAMVAEYQQMYWSLRQAAGAPAAAAV